MSQSQLSQTSTIPYEFSQDSSFISEILDVDRLYFNENSDTVPPSPSTGFAFCVHHSQSDSSSSESDNDDSDVSNESDKVIENCLEPSTHDQEELDAVRLFFLNGCGCSLLYSRPCISHIQREDIVSFREYCTSLDTHELDLVVKSSLCAHRKINSVTCENKQRQKPSQRFFIRGIEVCKKVFCFAHGIGKKRYANITTSLDTHGLVPRIHGNTKKSPHHALKFTDRENIKQFITRYAEENSVPLPGRLPNFRDSKVLLLPSDKTKYDIYEIYCDLAHTLSFRSISYVTFTRTWNELCPSIILNKPKTDLCHKCQAFVCDLTNSGLLPEDENAALLNKYSCHVRQSQMQRDVYRQQCAQAKLCFSSNTLSEGAEPCSEDVTIHYSWDYAQQVHIPHYSQQVGPIYFKSPRKIEVFGICCEGSEKQVFYLANEGEAPGKGANTVVSYVHHYLKHYGLGEQRANFHFDNCTGQNKNNTVLWYTMWRVITGLHQQIDANLMVAGHTKFSPDWHFGIWKSRWRHVDADNLQDVVDTVRRSSKNGHNIPQVLDDADKPVTFFDWRGFLQQYFKPLKDITKYHSFQVNHSAPGQVVCKKFEDSPEERVNLLRRPTHIPQNQMPSEIASPDLEPERQWYLHDQIRQFCRSDKSKEELCPLPKGERKKYSSKKQC